MTKKLRNSIAAIILSGLISILIFLYFQNKSRRVIKRTRFLMDTYCTIQIPGGSEFLPIINKAFDRMEQVDEKFNALNPESPIYHFNHQNTPIEDMEIRSLIDTALSVFRKSDGAFDITVFPLVQRWGFFSDLPSLPAYSEIHATIQHVDARLLNSQNERISKMDPLVQIDLGGIAKGYAIQEAVEVLREEGISSALIDAGGDIFALGKLHGKPWRIGIRNPQGEGISGVLDIDGLAVVTSGDYERTFEENGILYHHLLDPKTGYPARELASVTVVAKNPALADAWSTAIFILGKDKGLQIAESIANLETVIITSEGEIVYSSGLKQ